MLKVGVPLFSIKRGEDGFNLIRVTHFVVWCTIRVLLPLLHFLVLLLLLPLNVLKVLGLYFPSSS